MPRAQRFHPCGKHGAASATHPHRASGGGWPQPTRLPSSSIPMSGTLRFGAGSRPARSRQTTRRGDQGLSAHCICSRTDRPARGAAR
eukprot:7998794-Alexandrium_andersonii.AAC.1